MTRPRPWVLIASALVLFGFWSNSFIAISYLLGRDGAAARFDWIGLTAARFLTAGLPCAIYCFAFRRAESTAIRTARRSRHSAIRFSRSAGSICSHSLGSG